MLIPRGSHIIIFKNGIHVQQFLHGADVVISKGHVQQFIKVGPPYNYVHSHVEKVHTLFKNLEYAGCLY